MLVPSNTAHAYTPTMTVIILMVVVATLFYVPQRLWRHNRDPRPAMRVGMAAMLLFTGTDHFLSAHTRYLPMMPGFFGAAALPLVYITGALEILGALALVMPLSVYRRFGLPSLRQAAGIALAVMFAGLVIANVNVALKGQQVAGLAFGQWYFWLRPLLQPVFIVWALFAAEVICPSKSTTSSRAVPAA